ncbi:hypothetical protein [Longitalea arenae]|uniref:hypothetical protein n=1 Tax=Longitalea arenae TaxID=2812558 RepID=UPI001966E2A3|nr:hypothetical protein [Longitalea arenae]
MKRMLAVSALVAIAAFATAFSGYRYHVKDVKDHHATCKGSRYCTACKNCKYCGHCAKNGGSCGVCK